MFNFFSAGMDFGCQILPSKVGPRAVSVDIPFSAHHTCYLMGPPAPHKKKIQRNKVDYKIVCMANILSNRY